MPIVPVDRLTSIGSTLLQCAGASKMEGDTVAKGCVAANLAGHDSHGVIAIPTYIDRMGKGHIVPGAPFEIKQESATTTVIDGNWGFGFVVAEKAAQITIEKAKKSNVAAATILRQSHVGRVGAYPIMAAREGLIAIMTADSGRSPKAVAPFGGREARLGTNPICIAIPSDLDGPFVLDMATSGVAVGKIKLAQAKGTKIPEGWMVDKDGKATTDPFDYDKGGVLLPLGGSEGFKGYGSLGDGRGAVGGAARPRLRRRSDRAPQRRLLPRHVQRRGVPAAQDIQGRGDGVRALPQGDAAARRATPK